VYDDVEALVMQIPTTWTDIDRSGWYIDDELVGNAIIASPNLNAYYSGWDTPGVFFGASAVLLDQTDPGDLLDPDAFTGECVYDDRYEYEDAVYKGEYDVWLNCGGTDTAFVNLEAYPEDKSFVAFVQIQVVTDADLDALDTILATFDVTGG